MSEFKKISHTVMRNYTKRTIYDGQQMYDLQVNIINDSIKVKTIYTSQGNSIDFGSKEAIKAIIIDLEEALALLEENK